MKSLSPFRLSTSVTFSLSPELLEQINTHAPCCSALLRVALIKFLDRRGEFKQPNIAHVLKTAPLPKRIRSLGLAVKSLELRQQLDAYATIHNLTVSAVLRRAAYEYTCPAEPNPTATIDAWGDAPTTPTAKPTTPDTPATQNL